ncbi:hypothetical protein FJZ39_02030 [Candidatus Saccharibacteria bacterium]|nr:hypothetical protein [Candidatus Saccharibacteria bacterium]
MSISRGDTIIEVMFAFATFSMVAVGAITIMNTGTALSQRSLEVTLVRQQIDAQADMVRFVHDSYLQEPASTYGQLWQQMRSRAVTTPVQTSWGTCPVAFTNKFLLAPGSSTAADQSNNIALLNESALSSAATYSQLQVAPSAENSRAEGLWMDIRRAESVAGGGSAAQAYDVYIQSCWNSPGSSVPVTLNTLVRVYEPVN